MTEHIAGTYNQKLTSVQKRRLKEFERKIKEYNEGFPEMEKQRETYEELLAKYKIQLSDKQQQLNG